MKSMYNDVLNLEGVIRGNEHYYYLKVYHEDTDAGQLTDTSEN